MPQRQLLRPPNFGQPIIQNHEGSSVIPTYGIREMAHLGFLTAARVPPGRGDYLQLAIWRNSLDAFRNELHSRLVETDVQHPLRLGELMQRIGARPKPWANVLEAIRSGELSASLMDGTEPLAQRISVTFKASFAVTA